MKITLVQLRRAMYSVGARSIDTPAHLEAVVNAVLADPEVRAQIYREESGYGRSSLFGSGR
jgi:hypothetical protein